MLRRVGCALVAGLALWLSFPSHDLWWCAPIGIALLALATRGATARRGALLGLVAGFACFIPTLSWSGVYVGALPWFALATLESLYVAAVGAVCAALQRPPAGAPRGPVPVRPLVVTLAWVVGEYARSTTPLGGFPWARVAFGQTGGPVLPVAALLGAPGVTAAVALVGGLLAAAVAHLWHLLGALRDGATTAQSALRWTRVVAPLTGAGAVLLVPAAVPLPVDGESARITAVQGNVPQAGLDFNAQRRAVLDNHAHETQRAAADVAQGRTARPDLVLWPENASDIDPLRNPDAAAVIRSAVEAIGAPLVVGAVLAEPVGFVSNASLLYLPGRPDAAARYVKQRPAPFGEYIPYRSFFRHFSDKVDLVTRDFVAGDHVGVFRVPRAGGGVVAAGLAICFEVAFDDILRADVDNGANVLVVQTNNATFGWTDESVQQLAISRLRAVEHGRSVVHISNVGVSALITPEGTLHQRTSLFTSAVLAGEVPLRTATTLATRLGPWPERLAAVVLALLVVESRRRRRRTRTDHGPSSGSTARDAPAEPATAPLTADPIRGAR